MFTDFCINFIFLFLQLLAERFGVDKTDTKMEFRVLKNTVLSQKELDKSRERKKELHKKSASGLMEEVIANHKDSLPRLTKLATAGLLIPASTAGIYLTLTFFISDKP